MNVGFILFFFSGGNFGRDGCVFFAARGARVTALDNNLSSLEETLALVRQTMGDTFNHIQAFPCDVTSASSVQEAVDHAVQSFGTPQLLWNNVCLHSGPGS